MTQTLIPEQRLLSLLGRLRKLHVGEPPLKGIDLTFSQISLLHRVAHTPGCKVQQIAAGLGVTPPTVSVGIRRLVQAGLLESKPDPQDGRASLIFLSEKGQALRQQVRQFQQQRVGQFLAGLSAPEQDQLLDLLERAINAAEHQL